jgi:hypothetical protein
MEYNNQPDRTLMNLLFNLGTQTHTHTNTHTHGRIMVGSVKQQLLNKIMTLYFNRYSNHSERALMNILFHSTRYVSIMI